MVAKLANRGGIVNRQTAEAMALQYFGADQNLPADTWLGKYAMKDRDGNLVEGSPIETMARMARGVGATEGSPMWEMLANREFIPAGRILFGLGNLYHQVTLKNCYVVPISGDSLDAIFDAAFHAAKIYSRGGGVGMCLSSLRPQGARVNNAAIFSSGSWSFSEIFSAVTGTIGQCGRRGALMLQENVEHPDCGHFARMKDDVRPEWLARAKGDPAFENWINERRFSRYANVSVQLTDRFLTALDNGDTAFEQRFVPTGPHGDDAHPIEPFVQTINPQDLWRLMIGSALRASEPGLVFWDAIKRESPSDAYADLGYGVISTNPCGEMPLAAFDSCNLGSIHLGRFVDGSFTAQATVDWDRLEERVRLGIRFLDKINTIEAEENRSPLPEIARANLDLRRIGLGVMGLAEMFIRLRMVYGSPASIEFTDKLFERIAIWSYDESAELAKESGPFRIYQWERHEKVPFMSRLPEGLRTKIKRYGLRNVTLISIAPTGTIAIMGQTSGGIEPYYQFEYRRRVYKGGDKPTEYLYYEPIVKEYTEATGAAMGAGIPRPDYFVSAYDIDWVSRVKLQAAVQKWTDNAISSTVNLPASVSFDDVKRVFVTAWKAGCKGITVYVKGSRQEILSDTVSDAPVSLAATSEPEKSVVAMPRDVSGFLSDVKRTSMRANDHRVFVHLGLDPVTQKPIEVFIRYGKRDPDLDSLAQGLGILTSIALQEGMSPEKVAKCFRGIKAGWWDRIQLHKDDKKPVLVTSVCDAVALMLLRYAGDGRPNGSFVEIDGAEICPACHQRALIFECGCKTCKSCGKSECQ